MGYDLHITRAENWIDSHDKPISLEEWLNYVEQDPEMRHDGFAETTSPEDEVIRMESEGLSVWTGYSGWFKKKVVAWLYYSANGYISVKNPDPKVIRKMKSIAKALGAHVVGDEGENY